MDQYNLQIDSQIIPSDNLLSLLKNYIMMPQLVREIIVDQAIAEITCTPEEENQAKMQFLQQNQINSEEKLHGWLKANYLEVEQLPQLATREIKLEKFKQAQFNHQIESHFLTRKAQLDRIIYSLIRLTDGSIAQEIYFRILEGEETFADMAKQYSEGNEAQTGGLVGPVELSVPHPMIAQRLKVAQPGKLMNPVRIQDWWVILRLEKLIPAQLDPAMEKKLLNELFLTWLNQEVQEKVSIQKIESDNNE
jgi:parvulin-like peptidyl-prolyl isomerase